MAKRRVGKPKKAKAVNSSPVSERTRKNLTRVLKNARARVANLINKFGDSYTGPSIQDLYLRNVMDMIQNGVHINTIYAMVRNATASRYEKQQQVAYNRSDPIVATLYGGAPVHQSQYRRLYSALATANKNIEQAHKDFSMLEDTGILPELLDAETILSKVTSTKRLNDVISAIRESFTKKNLIPVAISETGEAGTLAEIQFLNSFITEENRKRSIARNDVIEILENRGTFKTQQEFSLSDVDTRSWDSMDKWRKRTEFFTDANALRKAVLWKENYLRSLVFLEYSAKDIGLFNKYPEFQERYDRIIEYVSRVDTEDAVRAITRFSGDIEVMRNYQTRPAEIIELLYRIEKAFAGFYGEELPERPKEEHLW